MSLIVQSLLPVLLIIALGWAMRRFGGIGPELWAGFERVTYHLLIPALVMTTLATSDLREVPVLAAGLALLLPMLLLSALMFAARAPLQRRFAVEGPAFTSLLQGAVRWNSFVAIALAGSLYGREGVALTAVAFAFLIPPANLVSVYALARYGTLARPLDARNLSVTLLRNPFIWSTFIGLALSPFSAYIPQTLATTGDILGRGALAAGLLLVGAGLDLGGLRRIDTPLMLSAGLKLVVLPALVILAGLLFGLDDAALGAITICAAVPTAAAAYILARQNGGDATLMASIITAQTVAAAFTLPLMLLLAGLLAR